MSRGTLGWIVLLAAAAALVGVARWAITWEQAPEPPAGRPPFRLTVTLAPVERGTLELEATLTGSVRSAQRARVGFDLAGRLASILVREGDQVRAEQPLAVLDQAERQARLTRTQAGSERARKERDLARAGTRGEDLKRLRAQASVAQADVEWTAREAERMRPLVQQSVISSSSYESMVAQRDAARARLEAAQAALALAEAGPRAEEIAVAEARVVEALAEEAQAQQELGRATLHAPFDGQVVRRLLAPGDAVTLGTPVLELLDLSVCEVHLDIPARHAARLAERARVVMTLDERPDFKLEATLTAHIHAADERSGATRGIVRLDAGAASDVLPPGTFVRARVALLPWEGVLLVPFDALRRTPEGWVLVKAVSPPPSAGGAPAAPPPGAGGSAPPPALVAEFLPVRVLDQSGARAAVEPLQGTLEPGMRVVVVGADLAFPGAPLAERREAPKDPAGAAAPGGAGAVR